MADNTTSNVPAPTGIKYPILTKAGKEYSNIDELLKDLSNESYGQYLLGTNSCWHGGIHISNQNEAFKHHQKEHMVRCMMDGTVVAYRLNKEYPTTPWKAGDTAQEQNLKYSNGFCLVKHDYVSPANKEEGANKDKTNTLTFYSLYMHLAAFSEYKQNDTTEETGIRYILKQNRNARDANDIQNVLGLLGKDSEIEVAENTEIESKYIESFHKRYNFLKAKIISTGSGTSASVTAGMTIYVNSGESNLRLKNSAPVNQHKKLEFPVYWQGEVTARADIANMYLYETSQDCDTHAPTVFKLKKGLQQVTFDSARQQMTSGATKHVMAECTLPANPDFDNHLYTKSTAWMFVDQQTQLTWLKIKPAQFDSVVQCSIPIKAGDPIGFMGAWDCPANDVASGNVESMHQMHIELFSPDDEAAVNKFINNEAGLKTGKQYLQIKSGATPLKESGGRMVTMSSVSTDAAGGVSVETVVAIDGTACKEETKNNKTYYRVKTALTVGNSTTGSAHQLSDTYLDSSDSKVKKISQYDLAALGYQIVDEPNTSTNGYVKPDQVVTGFFKKLLEKVDTDHSKELDANEIRAAQSNPELQPILGKIIGGHPSEWHSSTQQNIKTLFETKKATCTDTAHKNLLDFEKSRLQACEFMSQIPLAQKMWHFHPGYLINQLIKELQLTGKLQKLIEFEEHHIGLGYPNGKYKVSTQTTLNQYESTGGSSFVIKSKSESWGACLAYVKVALYKSGYISTPPGTNYAKDSGDAWIAEGFSNITEQLPIVNINGISMPDIVWALPGDVVVYQKISAPDEAGHIDIRTYHGFSSDFYWGNARSGFPDCSKYKPIGIYRKDSDIKSGKRIQAFLRITREHEAKGFENPYQALTWNPRRIFNDYSKHPNAGINRKPAGAYQMIPSTFQQIVDLMHWPNSYEPQMQDRTALFLLQSCKADTENGLQRTALGYFMQGEPEKAINLSRLWATWAYLPGGGNQQQLTMSEFINLFNSYSE